MGIQVALEVTLGLCMLVVLIGPVSTFESAAASPSGASPGCEDCCCPLWHPCCTTLQIAGHTVDYDSRRAACGTESGLSHSAPTEVEVLRDLHKSISFASNMFESSMLHEDCGIFPTESFVGGLVTRWAARFCTDGNCAAVVLTCPPRKHSHTYCSAVLDFQQRNALRPSTRQVYPFLFTLEMNLLFNCA
jgi:hypothetical protein